MRPLARHLLDRIGAEQSAIDPDGEAAMVAYSWPGNVRELLNVLRRSVLFADGQHVSQGQPLFIIDPRPYAAALAQAKAQVTKADAALKSVQLDDELLESAATSGTRSCAASMPFIWPPPTPWRAN